MQIFCSELSPSECLYFVPDAIFADPMCGSGTLLVEAGLMARNIAPGSFRKKWPFQQWPDYNKGYWEKLLYAADEAVNRRWKGHLLGCEISDVGVILNIKYINKMQQLFQPVLKSGV